jgi:[glutamine synthetase] adenylyltransferase / [glutamine synthetase]-adenylyl-L-tyrosine phosphorylase
MFAPDRLRLAPDPDDARRRLDHLRTSGLETADLATLGPDAVEVLWIACAQAPYLATLAARDPRRLLDAAGDPFLRREKPKARLAAELAAALEGVAAGDDLARRLRAFRAREFVRLGARECGLGDPNQVGRELANLADVVLAAAVEFHDAELARAHGVPTWTGEDGTRRRAGLVVLGMGKLGGQELNFASDIDVIYAYPSDNGAAGELTLHAYFERLARGVTRTLDEVTEDDVVFRVDLRLRPEGTRGALVNSLPSLERYYETWGRPWERQAWLKARPAAGDLAFGDEVLRTLGPFVYPRSVSPQVIKDVAELNRRIKLELAPGRLETGFDVKTGAGGIREIEFFVQALQLVHAGKNPALRERGTREALDRLLFAGLVAERERRALSDAYELLRQIEHRLQLESGRQTQRIPTDAHRIDVLARRLGFAGAGELQVTLEMRTQAVAAIFATLVEEEKRPLRAEIARLLDWTRRGSPAAAWAGGHIPRRSDTFPAVVLDPTSQAAEAAPASGSAGAPAAGGAASSPAPAVAPSAAPASPLQAPAVPHAAPAPTRVAGTPAEPDTAIDQALMDLGFRDPGSAAFHLDLLRRKPASPFGPAATGPAARIAPLLLEEIAASPDPDQALRFFVDFVGMATGPIDGLWQLLETNPPLLRLLASLFGTSAFLAKSFLTHPELLDTLLLAGRGGPRRRRGEVEAAVRERLGGEGRDARIADPDAAGNALRRVKNEELLRIGLADIAGELPIDAVFEQLSDLADVCTAATFALVVKGVAARGPVPRMAVLALGKLGAREMGYASDLDLVFVYDDPEWMELTDAATRVAQRLVNALGAHLEEGRLYEVDTRLRPSGQKGTLVSSLAAWRAYHRTEARLWERQALIRCRAVAGDLELGRTVEAEAARFVYSAPLEPRVAADAIARMRERMERELTREAAGWTDIKAGRGGIVDVEFAVQYLQLVHGARVPALQVRGTLAALDAARAAGVIDETVHGTFAQGYRFLRLVENRLRIVHDRPIHEYPRDRGELDMLARRAGFPSAGALDRAYLAWTHDIRATYERLLA